MTNETRTTIQLSDMQAVEFECSECHCRVVRPMGAWKSSLSECPECGSNWNAYRGTMSFLMQMASQISKTSVIDTDKQAPFTVRFELAQPTRKESL